MALRYVPLESSLQDNAPGYQQSFIKGETNISGPLCWKCCGSGVVNKKKRKLQCPVCTGLKTLPVKKKFISSYCRPGEITKQRLPDDWKAFGPTCVYGNTGIESLPNNLKPSFGEQLCVLVGEWRIFQRYGGHRWTTDDIVTAWVAGRAYKSAKEKYSGAFPHPNKILDLGSGNGSVLQMMAWQFPHAICVGIEARTEAVELARRSIQFNCGEQDRVTIRNFDFRTISKLYCENNNASNTDPVDYIGDAENEAKALPEGPVFDLITGTPPYFRVDFHMKSKHETSQKEKTDKSLRFDKYDQILGSTDSATVSVPVDLNESNSNSRLKLPLLSCSDTDDITVISASFSRQKPIVERAIIRQGGMPTCKESAPARCEFRGGIEEYCIAAAAALNPNNECSLFVVRENWLNHHRVTSGAERAGLVITSIQRVIGRDGKLPLFSIYTMALKRRNKNTTEKNITDYIDIGINDSSTTCDRNVFETDLVVRNEYGEWTEQYKQLLNDMSYPVFTNSDQISCNRDLPNCT